MVIQGGTKNKSVSQPFVSIVTVVYNSEKYLQKTIDSIKNQTDTDFEYIIIDGGSKDSTLEIIKRNNSYIDFWISENDKGIYDAMNKGIKYATGKYIWFINSGDEIFNVNTLEIIKNKKINADVFYGESQLIAEDGKFLGTRSELSTRKLPNILTWKSLQYGMSVSHQSIIFKKALIPLFNIQYKCSSDIDWVIAGLRQSKMIINTNNTLSKYLVGGFSIVNGKRCWKERFNIFSKHYGFTKTVINHLFIVGRFISFKVRGKKNY